MKKYTIAFVSVLLFLFLVSLTGCGAAPDLSPAAHTWIFTTGQAADFPFCAPELADQYPEDAISPMAAQFYAVTDSTDSFELVLGDMDISRYTLRLTDTTETKTEKTCTFDLYDGDIRAGTASAVIGTAKREDGQTEYILDLTTTWADAQIISFRFYAPMEK